MNGNVIKPLADHLQQRTDRTIPGVVPSTFGLSDFRSPEQLNNLSAGEPEEPQNAQPVEQGKFKKVILVPLFQKNADGTLETGQAFGQVAIEVVGECHRFGKPNLSWFIEGITVPRALKTGESYSGPAEVSNVVFKEYAFEGSGRPPRLKLEKPFNSDKDAFTAEDWQTTSVEPNIEITVVISDSISSGPFWLSKVLNKEYGSYCTGSIK